MNDLAVQTVSDSSVMSIEQSRAIQEVQASLVIAKKFPRDQDAAYLRIMKACERYSLADQAEYAYPRGGQTVSGPTIRLAEVLAQNWGNLNTGVRELSQSNGESEVEAFAWDLEANVKKIKTFTVKHERYTKAKGNVSLTDPRDIYEMTANQGARRERACILGVIPGDVVEKAIEQCRATVKKGIKEKPMKDQIRSTLKAFDSLGITKDLIEKQLGHGTDTIIEDELVDLNNIGRSIKDNMTSREEWFDIKGEQQQKAADLTEKIKATPDYTPKDLKTEKPAEDLKRKLDEGDKGIEEYNDLQNEDTTKPTVDPLTGDDLEQGEPKTKTLFEKIKNSKSSFEGMCVRFKDAIKDMDEKDQKYLTEKWNRQCPGKAIPFRPLAKEEPPPIETPPPGSGIPPFEQEQNNQESEYDAIGRKKFLDAMKGYLNADHEKYRAVLNDNSTPEKPLNGMNDVEVSDQEAILGFMKIEFDRE